MMVYVLTVYILSLSLLVFNSDSKHEAQHKVHCADIFKVGHGRRRRHQQGCAFSSSSLVYYAALHEFSTGLATSVSLLLH